MKFLSRDEILARDDLSFADVDVPEWGGTVRVRMLRAVDRARLIAALAGHSDKKNAPNDWIERMVVACAVDESGNPLFTEKDMPELGKKSSKALQRIFDKADELNTVTPNSMEQLKGE